MKLRILVTDATESQKPQRSSGMKTLYKAGRLLVEGSSDVETLELQDGRKAFLAGELFGLRSRQGEIREPGRGELLEELGGPLEECCDRIEGRYILVIAGPGDRCTVFADRYGKRDLYCMLSAKTPCIATDLSLMPESPAKDGYDQAALAHALCMYGYRSPKRHTPYRAVRRLGVRESISIDGGKIAFRTEPFRPIPAGSFSERDLEEYAEILLEAIRLRGSRHGNVVYLSSGWDSTSILACLVHLFGSRKVRCVTGQLRNSKRSGIINPFEMKRARAMADYFNVPLEVVEINHSGRKPLELHDRLNPTVQLPHHTAGGIGFGHFCLASHVSKTSSGDESVFCGEISDGAHNLGFSQFMTIFHPDLEFREYSDKMGSYLFGPTFFRLFQGGKHGDDPIYGLFRSRAGGARFDDRAKGTPAARTLQFLSSFFLRPNRLPLWSLGNIDMLTAEGREQYAAEMESTYLGDAARNVTPETLYSWYLHLYNSFHWQCSTIAPLGLTAEMYGLKITLPFWDTRLQEFLAAMPESWGRGLDLNPTKYPLKWMLKNVIDYPMHLMSGPHSYLYDVNPMFNLGAEMIYGSGFAPRFREALKSRAYRDVLSPDFFNMAYVERIVARYLKGTEVKGAEFRDMLSLCWLALSGWYGTK
jgi:hypothetical protein